MNRRFRASTVPAPGGRVRLDEAASFHAHRVLRLVIGADVTIFDGEGVEGAARIVDIDAEGRVTAEATGVRTLAPLAPPVVLLLGLPKGPAMDLAIRLATEAGVDTVLPVLCRRSVATGDRAERWQRIAEAAARQCGRPDVPAVAEPAPLADSIARLSVEARFVGLPNADHAPVASSSGTALLIGPEGGLEPSEIRLVMDHGFHAARLGRWVLRVETAAAIGVALLVGRGPV